MLCVCTSMASEKAPGTLETMINFRDRSFKYLLGWSGGKIESFSKSLMAQPERNKKFLWPTSMAEKFFHGPSLCRGACNKGRLVKTIGCLIKCTYLAF